MFRKLSEDEVKKQIFVMRGVNSNLFQVATALEVGEGIVFSFDEIGLEPSEVAASQRRINNFQVKIRRETGHSVSRKVDYENGLVYLLRIER